MLVRLAIRLAQASPPLRRRLWRWWYDRLARTARSDAWVFMNYGWADDDDAAPATPEEPERFGRQLYDRVVSPCPLAGRRVLEIGAGRGGGASHLALRHAARHVTAIDYSAPAIAFCRRRHAAVSHLEFLRADAERLPFPDGSFDAVVNIESSHCYGEVGSFFREAARVLAAGGVFLFADARPADAMPALARALDAGPRWRRLEQEDLTAGVVRALAADDARKRREIACAFPPRAQGLVGEFAALRGTPMFERLRSRAFLYHRFALRKTT